MAQPSDDQASGLIRCSVVFEAGDPPRSGRLAFWNPDGGALPEGAGEPGELTVFEPRGSAVAVPAVRVPVRDVVPMLSRARIDERAHPSVAFWGAATVVALQLVARGRLLPGVSAGDFDAWRVGPLEPDDVQRIRELAAAM
ncbi:MAG: ATP-dependent helicase, partial [Actinomadura sp.]